MRAPLPRASAVGALLALVALAASGGSAQDTGVLAAHSFKPPFNSFDFDGKRQIPNYAYGGNVEVNENFVRLTPDRAVSGGGGRGRHAGQSATAGAERLAIRPGTSRGRRRGWRAGVLRWLTLAL